MENRSPEDRGTSSPKGSRAETPPGQRFVFGAMVFNVDKAFALIAKRPREPKPVSVAGWATFFGFDLPEGSVALFAPRYLDPDYAMTTGLDEPVLVASLQGGNGGSIPVLIDCAHRIFKAHQLGMETLPAFELEEEESLAIREDPFAASPVHWQNADRSRKPGGAALEGGQA